MHLSFEQVDGMFYSPDNQFLLVQNGKCRSKTLLVPHTVICRLHDICHLDMQGLIHPPFLQLLEQVFQGLCPSQLLCSVGAFFVVIMTLKNVEPEQCCPKNDYTMRKVILYCKLGAETFFYLLSTEERVKCYL